MSNPIPEKVHSYNVYDDTEKLVGVSASYITDIRVNV